MWTPIAVLALAGLLSSSAAAPSGPVERAAAWMAAYTGGEEPLNFDAVIVLSILARRHGAADLAVAFARADERLDRDRGHPQRRFIEEDFRLPPELSRGWDVPEGFALRVNPDRVVTEALHCAENGWRAATTAYVCGPMRDGGGYYTAHGLWALVLARERGCLDASLAAACIAELRAELAAAQPIVLVPWSSLDIDLFAERLVMLALSGSLPAAHRGGPEELLRHQEEHGAWGVAAAEEPPYFRFHATMMAVWALLEAETPGMPVGEKFP